MRGRKSALGAYSGKSRKPAHLTDALAALSLDLSADEIARVEAPYVPHAIAGFV